MDDKLKVRVTAAPWWNGVEFLVMSGRSYGRTLIMHTPSPDEEYRIIEPTFRLSIEAAQTLMDDLWNCGLRPTEGTGSAGALAATHRHLEDMRTLVFKK